MKSFALLAVLLGTVLFLFPACATNQRYDYDSVTERYASCTPEGAHRETAPALCPRPDLTEPLGIQKAVDLAWENNPDVDRAVARIQQAEAMMDMARAAFYPMVSLHLGYSQGDAPSAYLFKTIDQRELPAAVNFNDPGWFQNGEAGGSVRINLFNGGRDLLAMKMAGIGHDLSRLSRLDVLNALTASVIQGYFDVQTAGEAAVIARESVETVKAQLSVMEVRFREGSVLKSDILSLKVRLAQSREELVRAENSHALAKAALANLMGVSPDTPFSLKKDEDLALAFPDGYGDGVPQALAHRPELKMARKRVIQQAMAVDKARAAWLPTVNGEANLYLDDETFGLDWDRRNWTAGVILNWDAFTGGLRSADIKNQEGVLYEMLAADRKATQSVLLDVKTSYLNLESAKARFDVAAAAVDQAEESFRLVKKQYESGAVGITRYLDTELALSRARIARSAAHFDRGKARAGVGRALGLLAAGDEKAWKNGN